MNDPEQQPKDDLGQKPNDPGQELKDEPKPELEVDLQAPVDDPEPTPTTHEQCTGRLSTSSPSPVTLTVALFPVGGGV